MLETKEKCKEGLTRSLERTATPPRSSSVGCYGDALWSSDVTGVITAGRLSLSSVVMPKKKQKELHVRKLAFVIEEAIRRLPNGETRLSVTNFPLNYACLSSLYAPDFQERLASDYGVPAGNDEIEREYYEEITTIEKIMEETDVPITLADWQSGSKLESAERMYKGLNRRAYAIQMWDWYGIPWRFHNGAVHLIWSPHDVMGSPIIHSYPPSVFLRGLAEGLEKQHCQAEKEARQLNFWKNFGIIILVIVGIILLEVISKFMA